MRRPWGFAARRLSGRHRGGAGEGVSATPLVRSDRVSLWLPRPVLCLSHHADGAAGRQARGVQRHAQARAEVSWWVSGICYIPMTTLPLCLGGRACAQGALAAPFLRAGKLG